MPSGLADSASPVISRGSWAGGALSLGAHHAAGVMVFFRRESGDAFSAWFYVMARPPY